MTSVKAMAKRELFTKILEDMEDALQNDPQGSAESIIDGILDKVALNYKG